jgi:hypothetical protein
MKIKIEKNGTLRCVYSDEIDLRTIGRLTVTRASTVEFNPDSQQWNARLTDGTHVGNFESRQDAIKKEIVVLESRL